MKLCKRCGVVKEDSEFHKDKHKSNGLAYYCKSCVKERGKVYREIYHQRLYEVNKERYEEQKVFLDSLKTPCCKCGESRPYLIQFHHIDPNQKDKGVASETIGRSKINIVKDKTEVDILSKLQLSGIPLIVLFILFTVISTVIIPSTLENWIIFSPLIIPLFMRANIAPEFTQFIFTVSSGIGKALTPLFGYFIVLIALLKKYNIKNNEFDAFSNFYKLILPIVITFMLLWLLIIVAWYISGLPIGLNGLATL